MKSFFFFVSEYNESKFFFGLATAPAHAEDDLDDAWIRFAKETPCSAEDEEDKKAKRKKKVKLAVGAITKGLAKNTQGKEDNTVADSTPTKNVAAWHNTPHA